MVNREIPEFVYFKCPVCDDVIDHIVLKGRMGKGNITGTFQCSGCKRVFSGTIRIPELLKIKVLFSDGDVTEITETQLESDDVVVIGDEFYIDDGRRVCVTYLEMADGRRVKRAQADKIVKLWVKQYDVLSVKVSVNDNKKTYSLRLEAEPDDEFEIGSTLEFEEFNCIIHAIKTKTGLMKKGSTEARDITRIYGKIRRKVYDVLDFEDEEYVFNEADFDISGEDDAGPVASEEPESFEFDDTDQDFEFDDKP